MSLKMLLTEQMMITCARVCKKPKIQSAISSRKNNIQFISFFHVQCFSLGHAVFFTIFFLFFFSMSLTKQITGWKFIKELLLLASGADGLVWLVMLVFFFFFLEQKNKFRDWTLLCLKVRVLQMCDGWYSCTYPCTAELDFKVSEVGIFREYQS